MTTKNTENIREQLIAAVVKKRTAQARAHQIVVRLLEPTILEDEFLDLLWEIAPPNYVDVVEERSINQICGYPLCNNELKNIPLQQYQISSRQNKVYDITDRKKFCSGYCFKASEYIKTQVPNTPLWLRDQETKPKFKLLPKS